MSQAPEQHPTSAADPSSDDSAPADPINANTPLQDKAGQGADATALSPDQFIVLGVEH